MAHLHFDIVRREREGDALDSRRHRLGHDVALDSEPTITERATLSDSLIHRAEVQRGIA